MTGYDWDGIRSKWAAAADEQDRDPRSFSRTEVLALGGIPHNAFKGGTENGLSFTVAKHNLFPREVPAPIYPPGHLLKGVSSYVDGNGGLRSQWIKTDLEKERREDLLRRIIEEMPALVPVRETISAKPDGICRDDTLSVYPMGDPHVGLLAWHGDAEADFDLEIAERLMVAAAAYLVKQGGSTKRAALINLGDFFHSDTQENRTRRSGNQLDVDSRYGKIIRIGVHIMIVMIETLLSQHEQVEVLNAIGNHDDESSLWLSVALDAYFRNEPRVRIELSPAHAVYLRHGKCLIGVTHGDKIKPAELEGVMAHDRAADWSGTEHRYWYTGHIHTKRQWEFRCCLVESFRTLAARDAYTQGHGYRGRRDMTKILLHREHGEVARFIADHRLLEATS